MAFFKNGTTLTVASNGLTWIRVEKATVQTRNALGQFQSPTR
jgi:hypothetical protein